MRLFGEHNGAIDIIDHDRTFGPWDKVAIFTKGPMPLPNKGFVIRDLSMPKYFLYLLNGNCDPFLMCEN